jgi:branched-chain amino acid transport system substrate-binding protein
MKTMGRALSVITAATLTALAVGVPAGDAQVQQKVLRIGQLGVMSGPAAAWGLINRHSAEAHIQMINEDGGFEIAGEKYRLELVSVDDRFDARVAIAGLERLAYRDGVKYVIGPNVDETALAVIPVLKKAGVFNICYGWHKDIFSPPSMNTALGMIAGYQSAPIIYKYLRDKKGVRTVSCLPRNDASGLHSRDNCVEAARRLDLKILSSDSTYEPGTTDFFPVIGRVIRSNPDLLVLSGVAPSEAPLLIRAARELGYKGLMSTETAMDAKIMTEVAGDLANGFVSVGGASAPGIRTPYMERFIDRYKKVTGEWNDEAGTKVYALEIILQTIKLAGKDALTDIEAFKRAMPRLNADNPFITDRSIKLSWTGKNWFGQLRQVNVPLVVTEFQKPDFKTLFIGTVD